ncbi:sensor histidine kinase [Magnetovibrio sp.]|uniref:sensor histidine kinase n=1 Tax=Magnetovibrio sp. TaxID=2024836 RepID=UPI002F94F426
MGGFTFTEHLNNASPLLALVMAVAALILVVFALRQRKQLTQLQSAHERLLSDAEISHEILATAPDGLFLWVVANNSEACSRRLAVLLGLRDGVRSTFRSVMECFTGDDAAVLMGATHKLRSEGAPFECVVTTKDGARRLLVVGVRAGSGGVSGGESDQSLADVLWMRDVSDLAPPAEGANISAREIIEAMPLPAWLRGGKLGVQAVNNAARVLGALEAARTMAERAQGDKKAVKERHLVTLEDGKTHLLDITEAPLPGGGTLGIAQDMTHAEETESSFTRHIQAQNQVLETLATAIAIYNGEQKLSFFNSAFAQLWDLNPSWLEDEPSYTDVLERLREQRRLPEVADFRAFKAEQTGLFGRLEGPEETMMHLPDGTTLRSVAAPHPLGGLVFAYEDVTDHLDLERSYKTLSAVQRETLDNLYEGVAVFGADGQAKLMNPSFERIWSLPSKTDGAPLRMSGFIKHITTLIQRDDDGDGEFDTIHLAAKLMNRDSDRGRVRLTNGGVLEYAKVPLPDGAVLLSYLDVTDSARVENALLERAHAMAEANVLKSEFMAGVSHEIRTPLNAIVGFASILTDSYFGDLNSRQSEYSRGILESAEELLGIIDNMLDLASVEAGLMTLELDTVDVNRLLVTAMNLVRERAKRKDVDIEFDSPADIGWVVADGKRLKQVLFTLLSSAVSNTPPGGQVLMTARREGGDVVFRVTDGGTGLKEDKVPPGLALIARFIELHNGEVELTNRPGRGTTVSCHLPAESDEDSLRQPDLFSGFVDRTE